MALPWKDACHSHSLRWSSLTCGVLSQCSTSEAAVPTQLHANLYSRQIYFGRAQLLPDGIPGKKESAFSALDFSLPDNEYVFLDLKEKLSKYFSKDWKIKPHRVSGGRRKEPGPSLWPVSRRALRFGRGRCWVRPILCHCMVTCLSRVVLLSARTVLKSCHLRPKS